MEEEKKFVFVTDLSTTGRNIKERKMEMENRSAQSIEAWEGLWKKVRKSRKQKHRLLLNGWKKGG